jgi:hypothetical protein
MNDFIYVMAWSYLTAFLIALLFMALKEDDEDD